MASHRNRRNEWKRNSKGGWTLSLGFRGTRVRLFQNRRDRTFYRQVWCGDEGRYDVCSLKTRNRDEAERLGKTLVAGLLRGEQPQGAEKITLHRLWERFRTRAPSYLDSVESTRRDYKSRANILLGHFGADFDVTSLTENDVKLYLRKRLHGGIQSCTGYVTGPVRARSADADLVMLNIMLHWATTVRTGSGQRWLKDNPLYGIRRIREQNPRRPVATLERYQATRTAMRQRAEQAQSENERLRCLKMELALLLAKETGRRLSAIRQLRWADFDFEKKQVRWRAEFDKKGRESVIPLPVPLVREIEGFRKQLGAIAGWVFARESDGAEPMDRYLFRRWLQVAEEDAGLEKLEGGLWHPYRRMWATARAHLPVKVVAVAGGWKDLNTLMVCYQQPDRNSLLSVMSDAKPVTEQAVVR